MAVAGKAAAAGRARRRALRRGARVWLSAGAIEVKAQLGAKP